MICLALASHVMCLSHERKSNEEKRALPIGWNKPLTQRSSCADILTMPTAPSINVPFYTTVAHQLAKLGQYSTDKYFSIRLCRNPIIACMQNITNSCYYKYLCSFDWTYRHLVTRKHLFCFSIGIIKPLSTFLLPAPSLNLSSVIIIFRERQESNPRMLGERQECYLCAVYYL